MEDTLKELNQALKLISTLNVSGDAVDVVAVAKNSIRKACADLKKLQAEARSGDDPPEKG